MNRSNQWRIVGRLGQDAEIKTTKKNKLLVFSVALDQSYYDKTKKEKVERVQWISCVQSYPLDNSVKVAEYLKKGALLDVIGKPYANGYITKDGEPKYQQSLQVNDRNILDYAKEQPQQAKAAPIDNDDNLPY